jgi:peptide deformylase
VIRDIVHEPDERLHTPCAPAELTPETRELIIDLADTLVASGGLGIAAPQLGANVRVVLVADTLERKVFVALNPRITKRSPHRINSTEGCLSIPGRVVTVKRAWKVTVEGTNMEGEPFKLEAVEQAACTWQHELDHLDGLTLSRFFTEAA